MAPSRRGDGGGSDRRDRTRGANTFTLEDVPPSPGFAGYSPLRGKRRPERAEKDPTPALLPPHQGAPSLRGAGGGLSVKRERVCPETRTPSPSLRFFLLPIRGRWRRAQRGDGGGTSVKRERVRPERRTPSPGFAGDSPLRGERQSPRTRVRGPWGPLTPSCRFRSLDHGHASSGVSTLNVLAVQNPCDVSSVGKALEPPYARSLTGGSKAGSHPGGNVKSKPP